jgi:hypothetical protein
VDVETFNKVLGCESTAYAAWSCKVRQLVARNSFGGLNIARSSMGRLLAAKNSVGFQICFNSTFEVGKFKERELSVLAELHVRQIAGFISLEWWTINSLSLWNLCRTVLGDLLQVRPKGVHG